MLVDSHCHLDFPDYAGKVDEVLARARAAGVGVCVSIGTELKRFPAVRAVAEQFADVWCSVGVHPHEAEKELLADPAPLIAEAAHPKVVAIGETGLDFYYEHSPRAEQEVAFRRHIRLAKAVDRPLMIHSRNAWDDTFRLLDEEGLPERTIFHCFTGGPDEARLALDRDCYLSFSGIVSFKAADDVRAAAAIAPPERVLVETDSPYLAPAPHRGKPNEPAFVALVGAAVADARGMSVDEIAELTRANAARVFGVER